jgi:hypothetical protein
MLTTVIVAVGATTTAAARITADLTAYHVAFLVAAGVAAGVAAVGAVVALTIHDADAASTMVRRGGRKAESGGRTTEALRGT